jgi:hypothetical protein
MPECLLAPVPVVHLPDAVAVASEQGSVAFGSDSFDLFTRLERGGFVGSLPVYVVASRTGHDARGDSPAPFQLNKVHLKGRLSGIVQADRRGQHPNPALRPRSAIEGDRGWAMFWELSDVEVLEPPLALSRFATRSGQAWARIPEGPVEAKLSTQ